MRMVQLFKVSLAVLLGATTIFGFNACNKDDGGPTEVIASFQYVVSASNFLEVSFTNYSQNAESYSWNFGDGNTSSETNPVHVFAETGSYDVTLTATGADGITGTKTTKIEITNPDDVMAILTGTEGKDWILLREGIALGIGEAAGNTGWWNLGETAPLGDRPCVLDDKYTFFTDGTFGFESNGTFYMDSEQFGGWSDDLGEGCHDETEPNVWTGTDNQDYSAYKNGGDYSWKMENQEITIDGLGAYIGLASKTAKGDSKTPIASKTYKVLRLVDGAGVDSLTIAIELEAGGAWTFYLVHYEDPNDIPPMPTSKPRASFSYVKNDLTVDFTNASANAINYSWNFGDGATSTEENPSHTYAAEGTYTVTLTADDGKGNEAEATQEIVLSQVKFTAAVLSSASGKSWTIATSEASLRVGPGRSDGSWWKSGATENTVRPCLFNDEFVFTDGGNFAYKANGDVWHENYFGGPDPASCADESSLSGVWTAFGSKSNHSFSVNESGDRPTITVTGTGAFIGIPKAYNGGEYPGNASGTPKTEVTYEVLDYVSTTSGETLTIGIDISAAQDASAYWTFVITTIQ